MMMRMRMQEWRIAFGNNLLFVIILIQHFSYLTNQQRCHLRSEPNDMLYPTITYHNDSSLYRWEEMYTKFSSQYERSRMYWDWPHFSNPHINTGRLRINEHINAIESRPQSPSTSTSSTTHTMRPKSVWPKFELTFKSVPTVPIDLNPPYNNCNPGGRPFFSGGITTSLASCWTY